MRTAMNKGGFWYNLGKGALIGCAVALTIGITLLLLFGCDSQPTKPEPILLKAETAGNGSTRMCTRMVQKTKSWGPFYIKYWVKEKHPCGGEYSRGMWDQGGNKIVPDSLVRPTTPPTDTIMDPVCGNIGRDTVEVR